MIFVWTGHGHLVVVVFVVILVLVEMLFSAITGIEGFEGVNRWGIALASILTSAVIWYIAKRLDAIKPKVFLDKETGEEIVEKQSHTMFIIPIRYWPYIIPLFGIFWIYQLTYD